MTDAALHVVAQASPADLSALEALAAAGDIDPAAVVAIIGKTEGNGCVNDFTRGYAVHVLEQWLARAVGRDAASRVALIMSGGCEGVLSPHLNVLTVEPSVATAPVTGGLAVAVGRTRDFRPHEIGTQPMAGEVAAALTALLERSAIAAGDVHFVQIKCPLLTSEDIAAAVTPLATGDTLKSMGLSRAAAALGVALALGEIDDETLAKVRIGQDLEVCSAVASMSSGIELKCCELVVLANAPWSRSGFRIAHDVMAHALDQGAIERACAASQGRSDGFDRKRVAQVLVKAEASPDGTILGRRHTMGQDSDISPTRMARAVVAAVTAAVVQEPMIYVSGGAEHQGPPGGGPVAAISRLAPA